MRKDACNDDGIAKPTDATSNCTTSTPYSTTGPPKQLTPTIGANNAATTTTTAK